MINPSASGWIDKFFSLLTVKLPVGSGEELFYTSLRNTGFIYGHVVLVDGLEEKTITGLTEEEITKMALLYALYEMFRMVTGNEEPEKFIDKSIAFYKEMTPEGFDFFKRVLQASISSHQLENIIDERIHTNDNIIERNFSNILTNALLFMDVLAFRQYLIKDEIPEKYLKKLEETVVGLVLMALNKKTAKSSYDDLLIRLFESSVRYTTFSEVKAEGIKKLDLGYFSSVPERNYLLDMAGMALWNESTVTPAEMDFLYDLASRLGIEDTHVAESIASFDVFIKTNRDNLPYFNYSNPVKHFYDNASQSVMLLIKRNSTRLKKELVNNGELVMLLTHSTHRGLDAKEKKKVKKQLLEMCKTIPSLTIFLLPGGSLLLPLLIKFIPQLLPSVFNENLEKE